MQKLVIFQKICLRMPIKISYFFYWWKTNIFSFFFLHLNFQKLCPQYFLWFLIQVNWVNCFVFATKKKKTRSFSHRFEQTIFFLMTNSADLKKIETSKTCNLLFFVLFLWLVHWNSPIRGSISSPKNQVFPRRFSVVSNENHVFF